LSRCRTESAESLRLARFQAAVTAARHVPIAAARNRRAIPFLSRLIYHFFTEYNARRRRASGMLVASFEADIMRKSSNQSI
jgi:hypothetical protein